LLKSFVVLEQREKKRRRTGGKKFKEKVNKKVDGQRKRKLEKSTKGKIAIERIQMGRSRSKKIKEKGKSYPGKNNNRGETGG
jgi:hypothetical protein